MQPVSSDRLGSLGKLIAMGGNQPVKHLTKLGLAKLSGLGPQGQKQYQFKDSSNRFRARLTKTGQIKWEANAPVTAQEVADVILFSQKQGRKLHINTGTHGSPEGLTGVDHPSLEEAQFSVEDFENAKKLDDISIHIVSQFRPEISETEAKNVDIIDAWCFSSVTERSTQSCKDKLGEIFDLVTKSITQVSAAKAANTTSIKAKAKDSAKIVIVQDGGNQTFNF